MRTAFRRTLEVGVMLVVVAGLAMSGLALAQTSDDTAPESVDDGPRAHRRAGHVIGIAADVIGIEVPELIEQLSTEGATLASIAEANGSSGDAIVAAAVEQLRERLDDAVADERITQEEADEKLAEATTRLEELVETENPPLRGRHRGPGFLRAGLGEVADVLGLTTDELRDASRDGTTLAELAEQQGVPVDDVVAALVGPLEERLSDAVAEERITQEEADEKLAEATERAAEFVETGEGFCAGGPGGGPGFGRRAPGGTGVGTGFGPAAGQANFDA